MSTSAVTTEESASGGAPRSALSGAASRFSSLLLVSTRIAPAWWIVCDAVVAIVAIKLAYDYAPKDRFLSTSPFLDVLPAQQVAFAILLVLSGSVLGLYNRNIFYGGSLRLLFSALSAVLVATFCVIVSSKMFHGRQMGNWLQAYVGWICLAGVLALRVPVFLAARYSEIKVVFVGDKRIADVISRRLRKERSRFKLIEFHKKTATREEEWSGRLEEIPRICRAEGVRNIVVTRRYLEDLRVAECLGGIALSGGVITDPSAFYERAFESVRLKYIHPSWFYNAQSENRSGVQLLIKRIADICFSVFFLLLTAPLIPFIWALIRLTSKGPVVDAQPRCGQFGHPFTLYKFRSVQVDDAKRLTPVGRFLRKTRLTGIPSFWNVLVGDMSLVGPTAEAPELVERVGKHLPLYSFRHWSRPGLTGLTRLCAGQGATAAARKKRLQHDIYYVKNWSFLLDMLILLRTAPIAMKIIPSVSDD